MNIDEQDYWQARCRMLQDDNRMLRAANGDLEEKLLNVIERTERHKAMLSDEIDSLSARLKTVSNQCTKWEDKCVSGKQPQFIRLQSQYKHDCITAVHMLQCQPSAYVHNRLVAATSTSSYSPALPDAFDNGTTSKAPPSLSFQRPVSSYATFPPTAIAFDDDMQPDDPTPADVNDGVDEVCIRRDMRDLQPPLSPAAHLPGDTAAFVMAIQSHPDYSLAALRKCDKCGTTVDVTERGTQTSSNEV